MRQSCVVSDSEKWSEGAKTLIFQEHEECRSHFAQMRGNFADHAQFLDVKCVPKGFEGRFLDPFGLCRVCVNRVADVLKPGTHFDRRRELGR